VHNDWNLVTGYGSQRVLKLSGRSEFLEYSWSLADSTSPATVRKLACKDSQVKLFETGVVVMKTGEVVWHFGLYSSECCTSEIELKKLQVFPSCPACRDRTVWDCVETEVAVLSLAA